MKSTSLSLSLNYGHPMSQRTTLPRPQIHFSCAQKTNMFTLFYLFVLLSHFFLFAGLLACAIWAALIIISLYFLIHRVKVSVTSARVLNKRTITNLSKWNLYIRLLLIDDVYLQEWKPTKTWLVHMMVGYSNYIQYNKALPFNTA